MAVTLAVREHTELRAQGDRARRAPVTSRNSRGFQFPKSFRKVSKSFRKFLNFIPETFRKFLTYA